MNIVRRSFYRVIDWLSEDELPLDAGDFRLLDRCILDELQKFEDNQPYLRGAIAALGFDQIGIPYNRSERQRGKSKFSFGELIGLALDGILNHSVVPLRIATYLGLAISMITFLGLVGYAIGRLFLGKTWPPGFATTSTSPGWNCAKHSRSSVRAASGSSSSLPSASVAGGEVAGETGSGMVRVQASALRRSRRGAADERILWWHPTGVEVKKKRVRASRMLSGSKSDSQTTIG